MELEKVEFTCPECGTQWTEWQDPSDDWFKLATHQTLCANCGKEVMARIIENWKDEENENLSSWPRSHG